MSNYLTNNDSERPAAPKRRRKLWLASGVAGLTGVVSLAAVGVATGAGAVGADGLKWATAQVSMDGDQDADREKEGREGEEGREGGEGRDRDHKDRDHKDRGKEVPCDSDKLIQAIVHANANHGGVFELAKDCTYTLTRHDYYGNGLPVIEQPITLKGHDTKIVRDATAEQFRIFNVGSGGHLTLKGLTIKNGQTLERKLAEPVSAETVWSRYSNSVEATEAAKAGKPYLPLLQAEPKGAAAAKAAAAKAAAAKAGAAVLEEPEANDGGGILVQPGGSADIEKSHIVENQAGGSGGGIANFGKTSLRHTTVADNTAFFFGGGILNAGVLKVEESHVKYNKAGIGGGGIANGAPGIFRDDVDGGTVWIDKTDISNNHTIGFGGGLLDIEGNTTIKYSRILDNTALIAGGGIAAADDSQLHLHKVTIAKNTTAGVGGGLALAFGAHVTAEKTEVKENFAAFFGGGVFNLASEVTFRDSEIVGNQAVGPIGIGGGIFNVFGRVNLHDTKVADNVSRFRPGGVFNFGGEVNVDDKSAIKGNKPTNCLGSPSPVENCFG
ncbi:right-handed parallel beta-helix repeat-containing protein [Micromonospora sp. DT46]|uniref:right-handed parallel beta-helix repeat-containing protein n=1 Tax=Micromonospora sp. DT46 TaxID=3393435 RepID=UPI003CEF4950